MTALLILIPLSLGMGLVGLCAFFWAMRHGQFDDPEGSAQRILAPQDSPVTDKEGMSPDDPAARRSHADSRRRL